MSISSAIGTERKSRTAGYKIMAGAQANLTDHLPQVVLLLGEANTANQGTLNTDPVEVTSADQAGQLYGYGSPIHQMMRILRPFGSDGIGGIPTVVMAQASDGEATATVLVWTITGTATQAATHTILVSGRRSLDFQPYSYNIAAGDTPTDIATKIKNAVNAVLGSPVSITNAAGVLTITTKWKGASSAAVNVQFDNGGNAAGVTYALTTNTAGTGAVSLATAFAQMAAKWYTIVINSYGTATLADLEAFNGFPSADTPTGRYSPLVFKPFVALFGSTVSVKADLETITDASDRKGQCTNVLCPAPASSGMTWEAAANMALLWSRIAQDKPEIDVAGLSYADMPVPDDENIGDMADYNNRDELVKKGCSTVNLVNGVYQVQDFVTTYHPDGLNTLQLKFDYVRNLNIAWNVKDGVNTIDTVFIKDKVLVADNVVTSSQNAIKPSQVKGLLYEYFDELEQAALINNAKFSKNSLQVGISTSNANRLDKFFRFQVTGTARILSTDMEVLT